MRILDSTSELREPLQKLIDSASRINANKPQRYWYPLSLATYDVEEVLAAVDSLCSFRTTMWEKTSEFENRFSALQGGGESVMVNSGSSADLLIAFAAVDSGASLLEKGDEVLVPSVTWPTQIWSLMMAGLEVRLVDTDPETLNMDLDDLESKIGDRTKAVSIVHIMGNPCDMARVEKIAKDNNLVLFEDCCEALGASFDGRPVGTFGSAAAFSFFFSHHITTMEGGLAWCKDDVLSDLLRLLRAHGWARNTKYLSVPESDGIDPRYTFLNWGFNVRPTDVQAAFGLVQLERLPEFHKQRVANAGYFAELMRDLVPQVRLMAVHPSADCSWFALPMLTKDRGTRDSLMAFLEAAGVETRPIVAGSIARQPVAKVFPQLSQDHLPGADIVHEQGLYVGLHPYDSRDKLDRLSELINEFFRVPV